MSKCAITKGMSWHEERTCLAPPILLWLVYVGKETRLHEKISGQPKLTMAHASLSRAAKLGPCKSGGMIGNSKNGGGAWSSITIARALAHRSAFPPYCNPYPVRRIGGVD